MGSKSTPKIISYLGCTNIILSDCTTEYRLAASNQEIKHLRVKVQIHEIWDHLIQSNIEIKIKKEKVFSLTKVCYLSRIL